MDDRIEKTVELRAPVGRVWAALTDHRAFGDWFGVRLDGPFAVGATTTGRITHPGYEHVRWRATVTAMDAPRRFAFTWPHPASLDAPDGDFEAAPSTLVEFRLEEMDGGGTRLTMSESGFAALPSDRRGEAMRRNEGGWEEQCRNIEAYVDGNGHAS